MWLPHTTMRSTPSTSPRPPFPLWRRRSWSATARSGSLNGANLYVANAHSDTISVVNTGTNTVSATIDLRPAGAKSIVGVTPNQMTVSVNGKTLYAALSDFDAVAAIDVATDKIKGEIPVGWYPTAVVVSPDGKRSWSPTHAVRRRATRTRGCR